MTDPARAAVFGAARQAVAAVGRPLLEQSGLLAAGVGLKTIGGTTTDEPCVKVFVERKLPAALVAPGRAVPRTLQAPAAAVRTDVEEMLAPTAPPWHAGVRDERAAWWIGDGTRHRPLSGGNSVSHFLAPAGTVATMVRDALWPAAPGILSCNHVIAALDRARWGDVVLQPATGDGGRAPYDVCGVLARSVPVRFGWAGPNLVDAAVAHVGAAASVPSIEGVGAPVGVRSGNAAQPGDLVFKVGRATGLTAGRIVAVSATGWIPYPPILGGPSVALFCDQIITTGMAAFGDSGALLLDASSNAIGLLFGGSPTHTFFNDVAHVQRQLAIAIALRA